ncbi:MAG: S1 RNA-binding domain-containing protein [Clostridia bacterium]|nr:S1 RNA-binding domain-containing protein [Clostridia bacterium]
MSSKEFFPEARYDLTQLINWQANPYLFITKIVHVKVDSYSSHEGTLYVYGKNFEGIIDISELSIYEIDYFPDNIYTPKFVLNCFANDTCITAMIIGYANGHFILSRKKSMRKALSYLKIGQIISAYKTGTTKTMVFLDIGAGINAIIPSHEISSCRVDASKYFKTFQYIPVKLIDESEHENKFIMSYKQCFSPKHIEKNDIVYGKTICYTNDYSGVFVELSPNQAGIVDTDGLLVVESRAYSYLKPNIVIGQTYPFWVKRIKQSKTTGEAQYALRFISTIK